MKWRHWAILIVLVLLNYIVYSAAFTHMAAERRPVRATRTPMPTFTVVAGGPVSWVVLPTSTTVPTRGASTASPIPEMSTDTPAPADAMATAVMTETAGTEMPTAEDTPAPTATSMPTAAPTAMPSPTTQLIVHTVQRGEYLALIARTYDVSVQAIVDANNIQDPNHIVPGQKLVIPVGGQAPAPTATRRPAEATAAPPNPTRPPATATRKPPTATPRPPTATPRPAGAAFQFTGAVVWDPQVAPNCSGPAISRHSVVQDAAGSPVNGVRVAIDCYGNVWQSHPSGNPGEYDAGHYDFAFGQSSPQAWTCSAYVYDVNGERVTSSQVVTIVFDTNECQPHGGGHQVAIVNWVKNW